MNKNHTILNEYVNIIWPLLEYSTMKIMDENGIPKINKTNTHQWYLYRQAFYGFANFIDLTYFYSERAQSIFNILCESQPGNTFFNKTLDQITWEEQPIFDPGRKYLILEHMYTGTMFRRDVHNLFMNNNLTIDSVCSTILEKYKVCWIEKSFHPNLFDNYNALPENKRLHKTMRPADMISYYENDLNIKIVNKHL